MDNNQLENQLEQEEKVVLPELPEIPEISEVEEALEASEETTEETLEASEETTELQEEQLEATEEDTQDLQDKLLDEATAAAENEEFQMELDYADEKEQEDKEWRERTGLDNDSLCGAIETILFMSDRPIQITKIRDNIDKSMPIRVIHESLTRLQEEYEAKHHGIRLIEVGEGYQFRTKATYAKYVQDLFKVNSIVLSPTALEVLAIVAYKQPVSRNAVDKVRGVDSSHILRALMDKRLVKVVGRGDEMGKPAVYGTTVEFLEMFNITNIDQLPPEHELEALADSKSVGEISDIRSLVSATAETKEKFNFDDLEEIDDLAEQIKQISTDTTFTLDLKSETKKKNNPDAEGPAKSAFDLLEEYVAKAAEQMSEEGESEEQVFDGELETNSDSMTDEEKESINELRASGPMFTEELDTSELDEVLEASEETDEVEESEESSEDVSLRPLEEELEQEKRDLESALDDAFEKLMTTPDEVYEELDEGIMDESPEVSEITELFEESDLPEHLN